MGAGNWGDDPATLGGRIIATHEIGRRAGYSTADAALTAFDKGQHAEMAALGLGTLGAEDAARNVVRDGAFGLDAFDAIFGPKR